MTAHHAAETVADVHLPPELDHPLLDAMADPAWVVDTRDRIVGWNRAAEHTFGLPAEQAIGQSALLFFPHEAILGFAQAVETVSLRGSWSGELLTKSATDQIREVEARFHAIIRHGEPTDLMLVQFADSTERRRRVELAVREARWSAARSLAAAFTHELKGGPIAELAARFANGPGPDDFALCQGSEEVVILLSQRHLVRELVRALLQGCGYLPIVATDRTDAARLAARLRDQVRVAVVDDDTDLVDLAAELRRFHPTLPFVTLTATPDPTDFLRAVAEGVSESILTDAKLLL